MKYRLRAHVTLNNTVHGGNVVAIADRAVCYVVACCVAATAVSCGRSGNNERSTSYIAESSMSPASVTEPTSKTADAAAAALSREEGQILLVGRAEQRPSASTISEGDIIARMASPNVSYSDFLRYADHLVHRRSHESPEVWLTIANRSDCDHRIRTLALFIFFRRHVVTPLTIHDLYHSDPYHRVLPSMTHALVLGGRPAAYFDFGNGMPDGVLILQTDYLIASDASVLLAVSGERFWQQDIDTLLSDTSAAARIFCRMKAHFG